MKNKYQEALNWLEEECRSVKKDESMRYVVTLQELVDKATPAKAYLEGDGYFNGELVLDTWYCPNCNESYEVDYQEYDCCPSCGQKIDWSDKDE